MIALRHDGPMMCVVVEGAAPTPCHLEVTADGSLRDAFHAVGRLGSDFTVTSRSGVSVFRLEPDGSLLGTGPMYGHTDLAQVLFCRLTVGPALECAHRFDPRLVEQNLIWNETNCAAAWTATVRGDEILIQHADSPAQVAAKLTPAPTDDDGRATALYLFALQVVEGETAMHAPREPE